MPVQVCLPKIIWIPSVECKNALFLSDCGVEEFVLVGDSGVTASAVAMLACWHQTLQAQEHI